MKSKQWRVSTVAVLSMAVFNMGLMQSAQAGIVETGVLVQSVRDAHMASIQSQLAREDVRAELAHLGVEPAAIEGRLAALSESELAQLATDMQEAPAGGDGLLALVGVVFVVLLILELTGIIDIFKKT